MEIYQKLVHRLRNLILGARNGDSVASLLRVRESDLAVPLLFQLLNLWHTSNHGTLIETVNGHSLIDKFCVHLFNHVHDFLLDELQVLCITSGCAAYDVVNLDVVVISSVCASIHCIGELDEDGVSLHDPLNVLATNSDDALVVLVGDVERDGSWHLLFHKFKAISRGVVVLTTNVNVEVVLIESIKDDLDVRMAHDLVNLAVLLATDEFFMFVCKLHLHR